MRDRYFRATGGNTVAADCEKVDVEHPDGRCRIGPFIHLRNLRATTLATASKAPSAYTRHVCEPESGCLASRS
jgi:hypothetical protein